MAVVTATSVQPATKDVVPARAGAILTTFIIAATVANLPLGMANVALPSIGKAFDATQIEMNLVAVGYSLGLAASVLWLGALGDRYGRKLMLMLGLALSMPAALLAAAAPSVQILIAARVFGGFAAGMAYPTTLSLINVLWSGASRTRAIALWVSTGSAFSALGTILSGFLLEYTGWRVVMLAPLPIAVIALPLAWKLVPAHVHEETNPVDNLGGILSVVLVGAFTLALNFLSAPALRATVVVLGGVALVTGILFVVRQLRAKFPLYDLHYARRRTFWVAGLSGMIVFGASMGAMFLGQQFMQNVLGYSTIQASLAILPSPIGMVLVGQLSGKLVNRHGSRFTLLAGFFLLVASFLVMLLLWQQGVAYWPVGLAYLLVGIGVGIAGTPSSNALTASVPPTRSGMASATADLQRDLGGAVMQSIFGTLLAGGFAVTMRHAIAASSQSSDVTAATAARLEMSFAGAQTIAQQYPAYATQIVDAARTAFMAGDQQAYLVGLVAMLIGTGLVFFLYPKRQQEIEMLASYAESSSAGEAMP